LLLEICFAETFAFAHVLRLTFFLMLNFSAFPFAFLINFLICYLWFLFLLCHCCCGSDLKNNFPLLNQSNLSLLLFSLFTFCASHILFCQIQFLDLNLQE